MGEQEKKLFEETVKNLSQLNRDGILMVSAATTTLLTKQRAEETANKIPAA